MSHSPTPVSSVSGRTSPTLTTTATVFASLNPAPVGIAETPSTLSPAAAAESPSCLSQIGSMITSIVSSIFSLISSLWNCVTGGTSQAAAPTAPAQTPAEVLSAHAQRFFNETTSRNIRQNTPHKVALLINIDGRRVALFTQDLPAANIATNPFREFCSEGMQVLGEILSHYPSLTRGSTVELCVADIRRHIEPEARSANALSDYRLLTTTLSAADNVSSSNLGDGHANSIPVHTATEICVGRMFGHRTTGENDLRTAFIRFIANHIDAIPGWTFRD